MFAQHTYSGLPKERLLELWKSFRNIGALPEDQGIRALDEVLGPLRRELDGTDIPEEMRWSYERAVQSLERLREQIDRVKAGILSGNRQGLWDSQGLRQLAQGVDDFLDPRVKAILLTDVQNLQEEANRVADEAEIAGHISGIREAASQIIHNSSSVRSIVASVDESIAFLRSKSKLSPDMEKAARQAKERAVRYRAQKKVDEAAVAEAGGNPKKAEKLRNEARVLLSQDWCQSFPGEPAPTV